ncbi:MAG: hypothetical protein LAP85_21330 [Acidobacteriia bacterium]|nr:hypothetical protein [Terriglobia bacterium]
MRAPGAASCEGAFSPALLSCLYALDVQGSCNNPSVSVRRGLIVREGEAGHPLLAYIPQPQPEERQFGEQEKTGANWVKRIRLVRAMADVAGGRGGYRLNHAGGDQADGREMQICGGLRS